MIGTTPPGPNVKPAEQLFYDTSENWYALNQQLPTVQLLTYP